MATQLAAIGLDSGTVLILIVLIVLPLAAVLFVRAGAAWGEIGAGPMSMAHATEDGPEMKEADVRQMLEARSYLRTRRGQAPLDVEAETERQCADFIGLGE